MICICIIKIWMLIIKIEKGKLFLIKVALMTILQPSLKRFKLCY
jgi:hypothetical protein